MSDRMVCTKCGKLKRENEFFKMKTGDRCDMCKQCLTMHIDNTKPDTFLWILEKFNVPYIERTWISMSNKIRMKDPSKFGPMSVMGQYLRAMNMTQYRDYIYADTDKLNFENAKNEQEAVAKRIAEGKDAEWEAELKRKYEAGEISKAEYETLSPSVEPPKDLSSSFIQINEADEERIKQELTEEDYQYLTLKWGAFYKPSEWVKMEELYTKYASQYDMNVDREETLKKICKTSLKMDQALDIGDLQGFKNLSAVFDQLRKSGKFTEAQNKEEQVRYLDSVGELVALCEREGGPILQYVDPDEYPQDKIDFTLRDLKSYNYNLAINELNLGDLIETYIKKLEEAETTEEKNLEDGLIISAEEEAGNELTDEEAIDFQNYLEDEIERDATILLNSLGGEL